MVTLIGIPALMALGWFVYFAAREDHRYLGGWRPFTKIQGEREAR